MIFLLVLSLVAVLWRTFVKMEAKEELFGKLKRELLEEKKKLELQKEKVRSIEAKLIGEEGRDARFEGKVKVFFMNLNRSVERREHIEGQLKAHSIKAERVESVNGKNIYSDEFVREYFGEKREKEEKDLFFPHFQSEENYAYGFKGLALTMMKSLDTFLRKHEQPWLMLLEDDAEFVVQNVKEKILEMIEKESSSDLLLLDKRSEGIHCCLAGTLYKRDSVKMFLSHIDPRGCYYKGLSSRIFREPLVDHLIVWMCKDKIASCVYSPLVTPKMELSLKSTIHAGH